MSDRYDLYCLDCQDEHGFEDGNRCSELFADLAKIAPLVATMAPGMRALQALPSAYDAALYLQYQRNRINLDWFEKHGSHRLRSRTGGGVYGVCSDECGEWISLSTSDFQPCARLRKHEGECAPLRDDEPTPEYTAKLQAVVNTLNPDTVAALRDPERFEATTKLTVFVVLSSFDYEGDCLEKVFSTQEAAERFVQAQRSSDSGAHWNIEPREVDP